LHGNAKNASGIGRKKKNKLGKSAQETEGEKGRRKSSTHGGIKDHAQGLDSYAGKRTPTVLRGGYKDGRRWGKKKKKKYPTSPGKVKGQLATKSKRKDGKKGKKRGKRPSGVSPKKTN